MNSLIASYISKVGKESMFSLIYADIDKFTEIVQAFGEKEANKIIEKITKRIRTTLPKDCKAAIVEDAVFIIFVPIDYDPGAAVELSIRLQEQLK